MRRSFGTSRLTPITRRIIIYPTGRLAILLSVFKRCVSFARALLVLGLIMIGLAFFSQPGSAVSSTFVLGFLLPSKTSATFLSPLDTGSGVGSVLSTIVANNSNLDFRTLYLKSPLSFQGRGFNGTLPASGFLSFILQLEGPQGFVPIIYDFLNLHRSSGGNPGFSLIGGGGPLNGTPLAGPGRIVNETLFAGYAGSPPQQLGPNDNIYLYIFFASSDTSFIGSTVTLHYGGASSNATSYFRITSSN